MGIPIVLECQGPDLTANQIEAFEREIGGRLPDDYRRFLLKNNGGLTVDDHPIGLDWRGRIDEIPGFDPLVPKSEGGLRSGLSKLREFGVTGCLPIASTFDQQDICIDVRDNVGSVWLAVYKYEDYVPIDVGMRPLADSFSEFLDMLIAIEVAYCPIESLGKSGTADDLAQYLDEGNSIDAIGKNDLTILCESIKFRNDEMLNACIERGAKFTGALHIAVVNGRKDLLEKLVCAGADVNEEDEYGDRPIKYVGGTRLPGEEGARNRALRDELVRLGAVVDTKDDE